MINDSYLWLKMLHLFGVVMFLGNIVVTGWWKNMADRTKNNQIIAFAQRQVVVTDYIFTAGGGAILLLAGMLNVVMHGLPMTNKWLSMGMLMFTLSGLVWVFVLIPTQIKQSAMATEFRDKNSIPDEYWKLCSRWNFWGAIATLLPLLNLYWMTFKTT